MHTILEHFRSALCNLKKGGIDLSLNKWVELVSLRTTDFSLTGIFLLFPFSLDSRSGFLCASSSPFLYFLFLSLVHTPALACLTRV